MMRVQILLCVLVLLGLAHSIHSIGIQTDWHKQLWNKQMHEAATDLARSPADFDYLIFRQIWPPAGCMFPANNTCEIGKNVSTWVVHGLWPSIKTQIGPVYCNDSLKFDFNQVKWLLPRLLAFWPNQFTNTPLESFWAHEWEKHGTCALGMPKIQSESDYFNVTLGLRDFYDFGPILAANAIVPDDTILYNVSDIRAAIKKVLGTEPLIVCFTSRDSDVQYLSQMQICMDRSFEQVDCAFEALELVGIEVDNTPQETRCLDYLPVQYPIIRH